MWNKKWVRNLTLLCLTLLASNALFSSTDHIIDANVLTTKQNITHNIRFFSDKNSSLTFEKLINSPPAYESTEKKFFHFGHSTSTHWLHFKIQNNNEVEHRRLIIEIPLANISELILYQTNNGVIDFKKAGIEQNPVQADIPHHYYLFTTDLAPATTSDYYLKIKSNSLLNFSVNLLPDTVMAALPTLPLLLSVLLIGIIVAVLIFNLTTYIRTKNTIFIYHLLFSLAGLIYLLAHDGYLGVRIFPIPGLQNYLESICIIGASLSASLFTRHLLQTKEQSKGIDRWMLLLTISLSVIFALLFFLDHFTAKTLCYTMGITTLLACIITTIEAVIRKQRNAIAFTLVKIPLLLIILALVLVTNNTLNLSFNVDLWVIPVFTFDALAISILISRQAGKIDQNQNRIDTSNAINEAVFKARNKFLTKVSHDIRTPMNGILGIAELLEETSLTPNQVNYLGTIKSSGAMLLSVVNDMLDYSAMDSGQITLSYEQFDLHKLINDVLLQQRGTAEEKNIEIIPNIDFNIPDTVVGDPSRLRQIINSTLGYAIKYAQNNDVIMNIYPHADLNSHIVFELKDTGNPNSAQRAQIERNKQVTDDFDPQDEENISISINKKLIHLMEGTVLSSTQENKGCLFEFHVPLNPSFSGTPEQHISILKNVRILIVDDNVTMRHVLQQQAESWGMFAECAESGQEALAMIRAQENLSEPYQIILLDHIMPGMNGLQLASRLCDDPLVKSQPIVIMLTGYNMRPSELMIHNAGISRLLTKPTTNNTLKHTIIQLLQGEDADTSIPTQYEEIQKIPTPVIAENLSILVVEDHHLSQKVITGMLGRLSLKADIVSNGQEAVHSVMHTPYDLVLMDCEMPIMDGYEATRKIRAWEKREHHPYTPIVALSAHILNEHKTECMKAGMNGHVAKPLELEELRQAIIDFTGVTQEQI